jgi:hypothetical protein
MTADVLEWCWGGDGDWTEIAGHVTYPSRHQVIELAVEARAFAEWCKATGTRAVLLALFGRSPSGKGARTDRRALFQVVTDEPLRPAQPLAPTRLRRRLFAKT